MNTAPSEGRLQEPGNQKQGALSRAARPEDTNKLAWVDVEADTVKRAHDGATGLKVSYGSAHTEDRRVVHDRTSWARTFIARKMPSRPANVLTAATARNSMVRSPGVITTRRGKYGKTR